MNLKYYLFFQAKDRQIMKQAEFSSKSQAERYGRKLANEKGWKFVDARK